jgi:hypothetical protein
LDKFFDAAARQWLCAARCDGKHAGYSQAPDPLQAGGHVGIKEIGAHDAAGD